MAKETPFQRRVKQRKILDAMREANSEEELYNTLVDAGSSTGKPPSKKALMQSGRDMVARYFPGKTLRELMDADDKLALRIQGLLYQFMDPNTQSIPREKFEQIKFAMELILKTGAVGGAAMNPQGAPTTQNNFLINMIKDAKRAKPTQHPGSGTAEPVTGGGEEESTVVYRERVEGTIVGETAGDRSFNPE